MASMEQYAGGKIVMCGYDPAWLGMFEQERARLLGALGSLAITVDHVGSIAVPGLAAKPIIDLLVAVRSLAEARSCCVEPLQALGYTFLAHYEPCLLGELLFRKAIHSPWTHHVHIMERPSPRWEEFILIRDYLRRHRDIAEAYGNLKKALALVYEDDIVGYRNAKRPFLQAVMAKARSEQDPSPA